MSNSRAGRTASTFTADHHGPLPHPGRSAERGQSITRRRAALSHSVHRVPDVTGFDGEVSVRYEAVYRRAEPASGERRLLLAVLEDGIRTLLKHAQATRGRAFNLRREALTWLTTSDQSDLFAFERICETLGIDADRLRLRVLTESSAAPSGHSLH